MRRAFTLIEVMLVVAIVGIMSIVGVAGMRSAIAGTRELGSARGLAGLAKRARATAAQTHQIVTLEILSADTEARLVACAARFGEARCADTPVEVPSSRVRFSGEYLGVTLTAKPTAPLSFDAAGFPCTFTSGVCGPLSTTAIYTVDHPERPGSTNVNVTVAGEIRVN